MPNVLNYFKSPTLPGNDDNPLILNGTFVVDNQDHTSTKLKNVILSNDMIIYYDDSIPAIPISGYTVIQANVTDYNFTLAAPEEGCVCHIKRINTAAGDIFVTTDSGVKIDGIYNYATFDAIDDELILGYDSATNWFLYNNNGVALANV